MSATSIFRQHRALRWLIPVGVVGAVGMAGSLAGGVFDRSTGTDLLRSSTAGQLISDVRSAADKGVSGTIIAQFSLGPTSLTQLAGARSSRSISGILAGSHTVRYWYGGPQQQRVVLLDGTDEIDVFRVGTDLWQWDTLGRTASHSEVTDGREPLSMAALMPQELAKQAIASIDRHTAVAVIAGQPVAHRATYQLALTPTTADTRVGAVRIAVDATSHVALGVQVYARGRNRPVIDVSFASVSIKKPPAELFSFAPPPGATVKQATAFGPASIAGQVRVRGTGWTSVVEYQATPAEIERLTGSFGDALEPVQGEWGRGRLFESALLCVLITQDGRLLTGAVDPAALYAAAEK